MEYKSLFQWLRKMTKYKIGWFKDDVKGVLMAWFIGKIYEIKPDHSYVLVLKKPLRGELRALGETVYINRKTRATSWFVWGPGLEVEELQDFLDERKRVIEEHAKKMVELDEWMSERYKR